MNVIVHLKIFELTALFISKINVICNSVVIPMLIIAIAYLSSYLSLALIALKTSAIDIGEL